MAKKEGGGAVLGYLKYVLGMDSLAFEEGLGDADKKLKAAQKSIAKTAGKFKDMGAKLSIGITAPIAAFATTSFNAATDAAELQSSFDQTFGAMSATMNKWAEDTGDALGRSTQEMQKAANTFGIFFNTAVDPAKAAIMSQTFSQLAQDLGSFYNTDTETAIEKLRSGLSGESEPLRDFGVFLTEANVSAKAMEMGLSGVGNELTEQEKILARYQLILEATKNAQGDIGRTSSGTANQIRASQAAFEELQVEVGTKLLPVLTPLITKLGEALTWFSNLPEPVKNWTWGIAAASAAIGPLLLGVGGIVSTFGTLLPLLLKIGPLWTGLATIISGTVIPVLVAVGRALMGLAIAGGPITLIVAGVTAVYLAWKNWDTIGPILQRLYTQVKTWLLEKLTAAFDLVKSGIQSVADKFRWLWDVVVGHSYVPDLVDGVADEFARLDQVMVDPTVKATETTGAAFENMANTALNALSNLAQSIKGGGILDILSSAFNAFGSIAGGGLFGSGLKAAFAAFQPISGFRANGGPVTAGSTYVVGERGPEMFTPSRSGYVHPNSSNDNGRRVRVEIIPSAYFDATVDDRAARVAAPMTVASGLQARSAAGADAVRASRRRIPGR